MANEVYIVVAHKRASDGQVFLHQTIESVWSSARLAEAAVYLYESQNPQIKYTIIERVLNTTWKP